MSIIVCISDYWHSRYFFQLVSRNSILHRIELPSKCRSFTNKKPQILKRLKILISGTSAFYLIREIHECPEFCIRLLTNPALRDLELLWFQLVPPAKQIIDYKWNKMLTYSLWEKIEIDYLMSWLSTLGGGFSALGEQFSKCAEIAGRISLRQLSIGLRLGDPFMQSRCKLYYSISLIQTGRLKLAKHIVRQQYKFAKSQEEVDGRLVNMCLGIWLRVQYEYSLRIQARKERQGQLLTQMGAGDNS